jgi:hypothetical protein
MRVRGTLVGLLVFVGCGGSGGGFGDTPRDSGIDTTRPGRDSASDTSQPRSDVRVSIFDAGRDTTTGSDSSSASDGSSSADTTAPADTATPADTAAPTDALASDGPASQDSAPQDAISQDTSPPQDSSYYYLPDAGPVFFASCDGGHTALTGHVYAPNGIDPIPNVRVYAAASINAYPTNYCDKCARPVDPAYASTMTQVDGSFDLDLDFAPAGSTIDFAIQIGRFRKHTTVPVTACQSTAVSPASAAVLPGKSADGDIPKIVVSSGNSDHLDAVLSSLGITEYDCYEGRKTAGSSTTTCNQVAGKTIADVLNTSADLDNYNMAFLSCAPGAYASFASGHPQMTANTQSWVTAGGRLFATDTAYDYVAQAFPSAITWEGASGSPQQPVDGANVGCAPAASDGGSAHAVEYPATIDDTSLATWLEAQSLASGSPAIAQIQGFYEPWSAIASLPSTTKLIAEGTMPLDTTYATTACKSPVDKDIPLTAEFNVSSCGRVVFSSFHTYAAASSSAANEKIMEYLIFAVANCNE